MLTVYINLSATEKLLPEINIFLFEEKVHITIMRKRN